MASYRGRVTAPASRIIGRIPIGGAENDNGLSPLDDFGIGSPYLGGSSPSSRYFLYQKRAASKACDLLANLLFSTCESTQESNLGSIVTPTLGLFSSFISTKIPPQNINIHDRLFSIIHESGIGEPENDKNDSISGSPGRHRDDVVPQLGGRGSRARGQDHRGGLAPHGGQGHGCGVGGGGGSRGRRAGMPREGGR